jgi:hypothetical protein
MLFSCRATLSVTAVRNGLIRKLIVKKTLLISAATLLATLPTLTFASQGCDPVTHGQVHAELDVVQIAGWLSPGDTASPQSEGRANTAIVELSQRVTGAASGGAVDPSQEDASIGAEYRHSIYRGH